MMHDGEGRATFRHRLGAAVGIQVLGPCPSTWIVVAQAGNPSGCQHQRQVTETPQTCATAPSSASKFAPVSGKIFRFHDLRHTCATLLLREGVNAKVVSEC